MTKLSCTRKIEFDAAHRIINHNGKCRYLHGHRYIAEVTFVAEELDNMGMVIDFSTIKDKLQTWINEHWDHNTILSKEDESLGKHIHEVTDQTIYYLPYNPTAENMAKHLLFDICPNIFADYNVSISEIKLYETPNCFVNISK